MLPGEVSRLRGAPARHQRSLASLARETMQVMGYDPVRTLVELQQNGPPELKRDVAVQLLPYAYPKLQNVEVNASVEHSVEESQARRRALAERMAMDPQLADAAQRLSLAAAQVDVERERGVVDVVRSGSDGDGVPLFRVGDRVIDVDPSELVQ